MGKYNKYIQKIEADGVEASEEATEQWSRLRKGMSSTKATAVVGPLIQTTWDQDSPYWNLCPGTGCSKAYTGCVATAMAQVMNYWQWPKKGTGSHSYQPMDPNDPSSKSKRYSTQSANFGNTTYDWANMKNSYSSSYTDAEATAVATLMFHCGVATEMMYGNDNDGGSGTYTVNYGDWTDNSCAQNALANFFGYKKSELTGYVRDGYSYGGKTYYQKWSDADWTAMVKAELDKNHPIMYGGASSAGGHSFICDGYNDQNYFHFNWGWSGENDGYFLLSKLKPGSGGAGGGGYDFSEDQDVIIGIVPDKKDLPKVNVTWWVEGETSVTEFTQEDALVLPTNPLGCDADKVFVGWTTQSKVEGDKPAALFDSPAGKTVMEDVTYYAVFAKRIKSDDVQSTTTYTFTSKAWAEESNAWESISDGALFSTDNNGVQVTVATTGAGAKMEKELTGVSKMVFTYCTNSSRGAGSITAKVGSSELKKNVTKTGGRTMRELEFTFDNATGTPSFSVACTTNSIFVQSVTITSAGGYTYSNYNLYCEKTQGIEEVQRDNVQGTKVMKVLRDGKLYILYNEKTYDVLGRTVK